MGIKEEVQVDLKDAFDNDLTDAVKTFVLEHNDRTLGSYSGANGTYTKSVTNHNSRGVFSDFDQMERFNTHIEPTDIKLIVIQNEIAIEPSVRDIVTENSIKYRIIAKFKDPIDATYILQLRSVES